jgi:hypothetical protein
VPVTSQLAGQTFGKLTAKQIVPERDQWGGRQWLCVCECGQSVVRSTQYLTLGYATSCGGCGPRPRTHQAVEAAGKFVCADHARNEKDRLYGRSTIAYWHTKNDWLKEGKLIRDGDEEWLDPPDADFFREKVQGYYKQAITFYVPASLKRCAERGRADRAAKRWQATPETFVARGEECVRASYVRRELGISKQMLYDWDTRGWSILDGAKPRQGRKGYPLAMVRAAKAKLEKLPSCMPPDHPILYTIEKASDLTGLSMASLRSKIGRNAHRLVTQAFLVRIGFANRNGEPRKLLTNIVGFTRDSVSEFVRRKAASGVPADTITLQALAKRLRGRSERSKITAATINRWCNDKLFDAAKADYWTVKGFKTGWIIANESANEALTVLRRVGWNANAATAELRALRQKRIAENGGKPLPSLVEERLAETRKAAEATIKTKCKEEDAKPAAEPAQTKSTPAKIGRPKGTVDTEAQQRDRNLLDAWDRGDFGTNKTEAARHFKVDPSYARKIINDHESGKKNRVG